MKTKINMIKKFGLSSRTAFTVAELLIALFVTGLLITAVAAAFNASLNNYSKNREIYLASDKARQALIQMTSQLRMAKAVNPASPANECAFFAEDGNNLTFRYASTSRNLYLVTADGAQYVLCDNVTSASFTKLPAGSPDVNSIQISMTVAAGPTRQTFTAAAAVRKNLR